MMVTFWRVYNRTTRVLAPLTINLLRILPSRVVKPGAITRLFPLPLATPGGVILHLVRADKDTAWCTLLTTEGIADSVFYWVALLNKHIAWNLLLPEITMRLKYP